MSVSRANSVSDALRGPPSTPTRLPYLAGVSGGATGRLV